MKAVIVAALLLAATASAARPKWHQLEGYTFDQYKQDFGKLYDNSEEHELRRVLFESKLKEVRGFNALNSHSWRKGINHMSDWTAVELKRLRGNLPKSQIKTPLLKATSFVPTGVALPNSVDYRNTRPAILTAVKDQGQCGSCWAHAATEEMETHYAIKTGQLYVLSQQQITSCTPNPNACGGSGGCMGGTAELAFTYASQTGMTEEWMYSYSSYWGDSGVCAFNASKMHAFVKPTGYTVTSPRNNQQAVMEALALNGPLAISVDASSWNDYESGIYSGCDYAKNITMDHAVQLVGYGTDAALGHDYWIVRNSWSASFGEAGYIRVIKESTPKCGWDNEWVTMGGGCKGDPNTVWACGQCGILYDTVFPTF